MTTTDKLSSQDRSVQATSDTEALARAFCAWPLPSTVCADLCATDGGHAFPRFGTSLLTVIEAKTMFDHLVERGHLKASQTGKGSVEPDALRDILTERRRQIEVEGFSTLRDDAYEHGELGLAAALYALPYEAEIAGQKLIEQNDFIGLDMALSIACGWDLKPEPDPRKRLVKAGALIVAAIERMDRSAPSAIDPGAR